MAPVGVNLSLLLLTAELETFTPASSVSGANCWNTLYHCTKGYFEVARDCKPGLSTSYYAVLATSAVKRSLKKELRLHFGRWHPVVTVAATNDHMTSKGHGKSRDLDFLEELVDALSVSGAYWEAWEGEGEGGEEQEEDDVLMPVANQIHLLMDSAPIKSDDYVIVDVNWVAAGIGFSSPSASIAQFGALLRLRTWHNAFVDIVVPDNYLDVWQRPLKEWKEAVGMARVWSSSQWTPQSGTMWRGSVNITEKKSSHQTTQSCISFPGFVLHLSLDTADSADARLLEGVGLCPSYCPSHLELLQAVDVSTLPLLRLSPLQCKLSLSHPSAPSVALFKSLFSSPEHLENVGYLLCLCQSSTNPDSATTSSSLTTDEWISHIHTKEDILEQNSVVHPLASYETGPILIIQPSSFDQLDNGMMSCDAWFLWKADVINASAFTQVKEMTEDEDFERLTEQLPILASRDSRTVLSVSSPISSANKFWEEMVQYPHELDVPPCDWKEIKALKTYEWIQRKMIKHVATSELTFGHMPAAPPPRTGEPDAVEIPEMLECFTEQGFPADTSVLSPIAVTTPSKPTRVHSAAAEELTYCSIIDSTPISKKKKYHGVDYCFSKEDSSKDLKMTKIQERYLISEKASHCSSVFTPETQRALMESRKKKLEKLKAKQEAIQKGRKGVDSSVGGVATSQQVAAPLKTPKVKLMPSAASKSARKSRRLINRKRDLPEANGGKEEGSVEADGVVLQTEGAEVVGAMEMGRAKRARRLVAVESVVEGPRREKVEVRGVREGDRTWKGTATLTTANGSSGVNSQNLSLIPTSSSTAPIPIPSASSVPVLRKSPRKTQRKNVSSLEGEKKELSLKTLLGQAVVDALKKSGMPRSHQHFKACYKRLYNLSKTFMKDIKSTTTSRAGLSKEMSEIVRLNVDNVITFQQRLKPDRT